MPKSPEGREPDNIAPGEMKPLTEEVGEIANTPELSREPETIVRERIEQKMLRLKELMLRPKGQRFLHWTMLLYPDQDPYSENNLFALANVLKKGILTSGEQGLEQSYQGPDVISTLRDDGDSYAEEYGALPGTFIIDPDYVQGRIVPASKKSPLTYQAEVQIRGSIPSEAVIGIVAFGGNRMGECLRDFLINGELRAAVTKVMGILNDIKIPESADISKPDNPRYLEDKLRYFLETQQDHPDYEFVNKFIQQYGELYLFAPSGSGQFMIGLALELAQNPNISVPIFDSSNSYRAYREYKFESFENFENSEQIRGSSNTL